MPVLSSGPSQSPTPNIRSSLSHLSVFDEHLVFKKKNDINKVRKHKFPHDCGTRHSLGYPTTEKGIEERLGAHCGGTYRFPYLFAGHKERKFPYGQPGNETTCVPGSPLSRRQETLGSPVSLDTAKVDMSRCLITNVQRAARVGVDWWEDPHHKQEIP